MTPIKLGVVVVIVFLIGALWTEVKHLQREKPKSTTTAQKLANNEPISVASPTSVLPTVEPTLTLVPEAITATATPTKTVRATPTFIPSPIPEHTEAYFEKMSELTSTVTDVMGKIGDFMSENPDFTSWTEQERIYYVLLTSIIEKSYEEVQTIRPPIQYKASYSLVSAGLKKYSQAMLLTRQGIDEVDTDKIYRSISLIEEGGELFNKATEQITKEKSM